jgi:hypothetical protein
MRKDDPEEAFFFRAGPLVTLEAEKDLRKQLEGLVPVLQKDGSTSYLPDRTRWAACGENAQRPFRSKSGAVILGSAAELETFLQDYRYDPTTARHDQAENIGCVELLPPSTGDRPQPRRITRMTREGTYRERLRAKVRAAVGAGRVLWWTGPSLSVVPGHG